MNKGNVGHMARVLGSCPASAPQPPTEPKTWVVTAQITLHGLTGHDEVSVPCPLALNLNIKRRALGLHGQEEEDSGARNF